MYEIKIKIHEEAELYNPLDPEQTLLADEVVAYVSRRYEEASRSERFCIHIFSDTPVNEERVRENFRINMEHQQDIETKEMKTASLKQLWLFFIGICFIAIWLFAAGMTENLGVEVLSIIGSFAVWEAANIWIVEKPYIRLRKLVLYSLSKTEIRFTITDPQSTERSFCEP